MYFGAEFAEAIDERHRKYQYILDFWELTRLMRIPVKQGDYNSTVYLPGPHVTLDYETYHGYWTFTRFHELAHTVLRESGIEKKLYEEAEYPEQFRSWVEAYCNYGAAQFQMPNPLLRQVLEWYGYHPRAILELAKLTGVDLFDAMNRLTHDLLDPDARRASFLTQSSYLRKVVTTNDWFPYSEGDRVPEVMLSLPGAKLLKLPERFGQHRVLGVVGR